MSEKRPPATREHHDRFCETEAWVLVRGASGKPVTHHRTYELTLWDGRILRTRISRPVDRSEYAASMWSHILRTQLEVVHDVFWACVLEGVRPDRGEPQPLPSRRSVPLYLRDALRDQGVPDDDILGLDAAGAAELLARMYTSRGE
ncbi:cytotoxic translational repressor of toxin-antitoxin stability system [Rathayibacter caricis]|uniref:cytotoxic translational repressor of toxin-antitoxin stability system n=1 Tax=Rathayibacter caricis TaxID=110936 RepID=UPI001FB48E0C|nr:cytotoxic translational repressor of toxin-antitoxin stability system [Rathayibacter caricis]MCJ1697219.1 cytotoxic translational repressor of toxin-antitoxin stability system [Rathayibacter caricis]